MNQTTLISAGTETIEMIDDDHMTGMSDDDDDDGPSSPESAYVDGDLMNAMDDDVTAQLAAAGPVGVAAAAAIASAKKRKRPHSFETNPSIRKRQQNRLLRKLRVSRPCSHPAALQGLTLSVSSKLSTNSQPEWANRRWFWSRRRAN